MTITEFINALNAAALAEEDFPYQLGKLKEALAAEPEIRIYIDDSMNFGHQSTTIAMMKHFIDWVEYRNKITIVYFDDPRFNKLAETASKLAILLPQLDVKKLFNNPEGNTISYGTCENITFVRMDHDGDLTSVLGRINFGFTGGSDRTNGIRGKMNVAFFLRLQPYLWHYPNEIEIFKKDGTLSQIIKLEKKFSHFKKTLFSYNLDQMRQVNEATWEWYTNDMIIYEDKGGYLGESAVKTQQFRRRIQNARVIANRLAEMDLWPVYGMQVFRALGEDTLGQLMLNIVIAALLRKKVRQMPIVIPLFQNIVKVAGSDSDIVEDDLFAYVNGFIEGEKGLRKVFSSRSTVNPEQKGNVEKNIVEIRKKLRFKPDTPINEIHIVDSLEGIVLHPAGVYVVKVGSVPMDIFNLFYIQAKMPPIFEGQGTSGLVINTGKPFIQFSVSKGGCNYPARVFNGNNDVMATRFHSIASNFVKSYDEWNQESKNAYFLFQTEEFQTFIYKGYDISSPEGRYFQRIARVYRSDKHNKFKLGMLRTIFQQKKKIFDKENQITAIKDIAAFQTLEEVYAIIINAIQDGKIDFVTALKGSKTAQYYENVMNGHFIAQVDQTNIHTEKNDSGKMVNIKVDHAKMKFLGIEFTFAFMFTYYDDTKAVLSSLTASSDSTYQLPFVPWIVFEKLGFHAEVIEGDLPFKGYILGRLKGTKMDISISYPVLEHAWIIKGEFDTPVTMMDGFYQIAGGVHLIQELPSPLKELDGFGIKEIEFTYDTKSSQFTYMKFHVCTDAPWVLVEKPLFQIAPFVDIYIYNPQDLNERRIECQIKGEFTIGEGKISVIGQYPNFEVSAELVENKIDLNTFVEMFGGTIDLKSSITVFRMSMKPEKKEYLIHTAIESDWDLFGLFTIKQLGFYVMNSPRNTELKLSGRLIILPESVHIHLSLSASYTSEKKSWIFIGKQTDGGIPQISGLLLKYLGWNINLNDLPVLEIGIFVDTSNKDWELNAKTKEPFAVPFIPELNLAAEMKLGEKSDKSNVPKKYGRIETNWTWKEISLLIWYDYQPETQSFGITWNQLEAIVSKKNNEWIGEIKFTQDTTLGSMIEEMVSWITGSRFGLEAPWNILNSVSISNLSLIYNFTKEKVSFKVNIGKIDLGIAQINGIAVSYETGNENPDDNGLMVSLDGTFPWNTGSDANGDTDKLGPWDASKPGTAPSPNGSGNKYFDLEMLALGQHVTFDGFKTAARVEDVIKAMRTMPKPKAGKIPDVTYASDNSWLIGADFNVLKLTGKDESGYLLKLQTVFNDPYLYALRIKLAGDAAKVFKNLDFQIMYKKINDNLGVYQAEITLPDSIRYLDFGGVSITLPVFAIAVYTNGDFQVDIGFPWNEDFKRSFSVEAIVYPGIPLVGSGGFYFGKLSSATSDKVPVSSKGSFNPVLVFGIGLQVGLGKSIHYGILEAGFSLTVVGILEGVIAKWNPYQLEGSKKESHSVQDSYYYSIQGTVGIIGKLYGSVDFGIIKASVDITIKLLLRFLLESYKPIVITVECGVSIKLKITINLGLFKIKINLSFSMTIKESFKIANSGQAPWDEIGTKQQIGVIRNHQYQGLMEARQNQEEMYQVDWENHYLLPQKTPVDLHHYLVTALTVARDEWDAGFQTKNQVPCYVAMMFMETKSAEGNGESSFEIFCSYVFYWMVAVLKQKKMSKEEVLKTKVSKEELQRFLAEELTGTDEKPSPIPTAAVKRFLSDQFKVLIHQKPRTLEKEGNIDEINNAAYFPILPWLSMTTSSYPGDTKGVSYEFSQYNEVSEGKLKELRTYFNQLAVTVEKEMKKEKDLKIESQHNASFSLSEWIFTDYFLLIGKQMVQAFINALEDYSYEIKSLDTPDKMIQEINEIRGIQGEKALHLFDLFEANKTHLLNSNKKIKISGVEYEVGVGDTFLQIADYPLFAKTIKPDEIACYAENAENTNILSSGTKIQYEDKVYQVLSNDSLRGIAEKLNTDVSSLVKKSNVLTCEGLLSANAGIKIPAFDYTINSNETLHIIIQKFGIKITDLTDTQVSKKANGTVTDLFSTKNEKCLHIPYLNYFRVDELMKSIKMGSDINNLASMATRYYLHGLRFTTDGITPKSPGLWVNEKSGKYTLPESAGVFALSGQQFRIPSEYKNDTYTITFKKYEPWIIFSEGADEYNIDIAPNSDDALRIESTIRYAKNNILSHNLEYTGFSGMVETKPASYNFASAMGITSKESIKLPFGTYSDPLKSLKAWKFPDAFVQGIDAAGRRCNAYFNMKKGNYNEGLNKMTYEPIYNYGLSTVVEINIKKEENTNVSGDLCCTYEITGAKASDVTLLEKLVTVQQDIEHLYFNIFIGYNQGDGQAVLDELHMTTYDIVKVNMSTDTNPSSFSYQRFNKKEKGVLGDEKEMIRLLWEALITNSGGFYLYYYYNNEDQTRGLPDTIFDEKGQAKVSFMILFHEIGNKNGQNMMYDFMNTLITCDMTDDPNSILLAEACINEQNVKMTAEESLEEFCYSYYSDPGDFATNNPYVTLHDSVVIENGTYMVIPNKEPGGAVGKIARYFNVGVEALKACNPKIENWSDDLEPYVTIHLPKLTAPVLSSNNTLKGIADFYGCDVKTVAHSNKSRKNIFTPGDSTKLLSGCKSIKATVAPGVAAYEFRMDEVDEVLDDPKDIDYGKKYLQNNFTLLGYRVVDNVDFIQSNQGLPAGPQSDEKKWKYKISLAYDQILKKSVNENKFSLDQNNNPYLSVNTIHQMDYCWQDFYGNTIASQFSSYEQTKEGFVNKMPMANGYTDSIIGIAAWPSVSIYYNVISVDMSTGAFLITLPFDTSQYKEKKDKAVLDINVYNSLFYQLTDPNGIAFTIETSLTAKGFIPLDENMVSDLYQWLFYNENSIYHYLEEMIKTGDSQKIVPPMILTVPFKKEDVNQKQLYELQTFFTIERNNKTAWGSFASIPGIFISQTTISPYTQTDGKHYLEEFANSFERSFETQSMRRRIMCGMGSKSSNNDALWVLSQSKVKNQGVYFDFLAKDNVLAAMRPISNRLEGKNEPVLIPVYQTGKEIGDIKEMQSILFRNIDMDIWLKCLVEAVDDVLQYAVNIHMIDQIMGKSYYKALLSQKESLADLLKEYMTPILVKDSNEKILSVKEAVYQSLLSKLSNLYQIQGGVVTRGYVNADIKESIGGEAPKLLGNIKVEDKAGESYFSITSPKLQLDQNEKQEIAYLISAPDMIRDKNGGVISGMDLDLYFEGKDLEHQIHHVKGIDGYIASSWLHFVTESEEDLFKRPIGNMYFPFLLRNYPEIPQLGMQKDFFDRINVLNWDYEFDYSRSYHYPQDKVECSVKFNFTGPLKGNRMYFDQLFDQLAAFTTLQEPIRKDLQQYVSCITPDMDQKSTNVRNGSAAVSSFITLVERIVEPGRNALFEHNDLWRNSDEIFQYDFTVQEDDHPINGEEDILIVTITGAPPKDISWPAVLIEPQDYTIKIYKESQNAICYYYVNNKTGIPLGALEGQSSKKRVVRIPDLYLLKYQSVISKIQVKRNEQKIDESEVADCFIYQTGEIEFSSLLYPSNDVSEPVEMNFYEGKSTEVKDLKQHLLQFFTTLFKGELNQNVSIQIEGKYQYKMNEGMSYIDLPVFLQPPLDTKVKPIEEMIEEWSTFLSQWYGQNVVNDSGKSTWNINGKLSFDLVFMSNLTDSPMQLFRIRDLFIYGKYIKYEET